MNFKWNANCIPQLWLWIIVCTYCLLELYAFCNSWEVLSGYSWAWCSMCVGQYLDNALLVRPQIQCVSSFHNPNSTEGTSYLIPMSWFLFLLWLKGKMLLKKKPSGTWFKYHNLSLNMAWWMWLLGLSVTTNLFKKVFWTRAVRLSYSEWDVLQIMLLIWPLMSNCLIYYPQSYQCICIKHNKTAFRVVCLQGNSSASPWIYHCDIYSLSNLLWH